MMKTKAALKDLEVLESGISGIWVGPLTCLSPHKHPSSWRRLANDVWRVVQNTQGISLGHGEILSQMSKILTWQQHLGIAPQDLIQGSCSWGPFWIQEYFLESIPSNVEGRDKCTKQGSSPVLLTNGSSGGFNNHTYTLSTFHSSFVNSLKLQAEHTLPFQQKENPGSDKLADQGNTLHEHWTWRWI